MRVLIIAWYRLKSAAGSPLTVLLMLLVPVAAVLAADALWVRSGGAIPVAVADLDRTPWSRLVVERLAARDVLSLSETSAAEAARRVQTQRAEAAFILEAGFMDRVAAGRWDGAVRLLKSPASLLAEMAGEYAASEVMRLAANSRAASDVVAEYRRLGRVAPAAADRLWQEAWDHADSYWEPEPLMTLSYRELQGGRAAVPAGTTRRGVPLYALLATLVLFNSLLAAGWMVEDRRSGVLHRTITTGTRLTTYVAGHGLAVLVVGAATLAGALGVLAWRGSAPDLAGPDVALLGSYLACAAGLSMLVSMAFRSGARLQVAVPFLTLLTALLGSGLAGLGDLAGRLRALAYLTPQGWLLAGLRERLAVGLPPLVPAVVLLGAAAACLIAVSWLASRETAETGRSAA